MSTKLKQIKDVEAVSGFLTRKAGISGRKGYFLNNIKVNSSLDATFKDIKTFILPQKLQ